MISIFVLATIGVAGAACAFVDDWTRFRGPAGQGIAATRPAMDAPVQFDLDHGVVWRTPIEGKGWSSPVSDGSRIWLTTAITQNASEEEQRRKLATFREGDMKQIARSVDFFAVCVDFESGRVVQKVRLGTTTDPQPIHPLNTYASPTPVLDGDRLFCHFGNYGTWCLDAVSGETIWQKALEVDYSVGPGSSPIIWNDLLILTCDGCDQQFVVAWNKFTGEQVWKTNRPPLRATEVELRKSFSTPIVIDVAGQPQLVVPCAQWIVAYEPQTGAEIWRIDHGDGFSLGVTPIFSHGLVIFSTGFGKPDLVAVRPDGRGDVTKTHVVWRCQRGAPNKPSPIVVGDALYMLADNGVLTQLRVADGTEVWRKRIGSDFSASPVAVGDKIYFPAHDGTVVVIRASEDFQLLSENKLEPRLMASPAVLNGDLIIRSEDALFRISTN